MRESLLPNRNLEFSSDPSKQDKMQLNHNQTKIIISQSEELASQSQNEKPISDNDSSKSESIDGSSVPPENSYCGDDQQKD